MFKILQALGVLCFLIWIVFTFACKRKRSKGTVAALCLLTLVAAVISNAVLGWIPMATEPITLTARGERSEQAKSDEVALVGVIADGKRYEISNAVEGKWFWQGEQYMWRNEGDTRQPAGTTRSITLDIPIGAGRALVFNNNPWRGKVDITFKGETKTYDLYSEAGQEVQIPIPETNPLYDDAIKIGRLALFGAFMLALMAYPLFVVSRASDKVLRAWLEQHWDKLFYLTLAVLYVLLLQKNSADGSFWGDEMEQLGWAYGDMPGSASLFIGALYRAWVHLVTYGQENLLLLPQLFVGASIYLCGVMGSRFRGKRFGVIFSSVMAFSVVVAEQCAMEFRPYPILLFLTTLVSYVFARMQQETKHSLVAIMLYGALLALTMDSHQFGVVVAGLFLVADFLLLLLRRRSLKWLCEWIFPAIYGVYWISTTFLSNYKWLQGGYGSTRWAGKATAGKVFEIVTWLCDNSKFLTLVMLGGTVGALTVAICHLKDKRFQFSSDYVDLVFAYVPITALLVVWFFSAVLFPNDTLLLDRYFISCEVFFLYFMSVGLDMLVEFAGGVYKNETVCVGATVFIVCALCLFNWTRVGPWTLYPASARSQNHHFREAAEYLMSRNDIYREDTLCIIDHNQESANQAMEYYLSEKGKRDSINHLKIWDSYKDPKLQAGEYKQIYVTNLYRGGRSVQGLNEFLDANYTRVDLDVSYIYLYVKNDP